jgi:hypothetical protein
MIAIAPALDVCRFLCTRAIPSRQIVGPVTTQVTPTTINATSHFNTRRIFTGTLSARIAADFSARGPHV